MTESSEKEFHSKKHDDFFQKKRFLFRSVFLRSQKNWLQPKQISKTFNFQSITQSYEKQKLFSYFFEFTLMAFFDDFLNPHFEKKTVKNTNRFKNKNFLFYSSNPLFQSKFSINSFIFSPVESFSFLVFLKRRFERTPNLFGTHFFKENFFKLQENAENLRKNWLQDFKKQLQRETHSSFFYFQFFEFKMKFYKSIRQSKSKKVGKKFQKFVVTNQTLQCFLTSQFSKGFLLLQMFLSYEKTEPKKKDSFLKKSLALYFSKKQFFIFYVSCLHKIQFLRKKTVNLAHFVYKHFSNLFYKNRPVKLINSTFILNYEVVKTDFYDPLFFESETNEDFDFQTNNIQNLIQKTFRDWNFTKKHFLYLNKKQLKIEGLKTTFYKSFLKFLSLKSRNNSQIQKNQKNSVFSLSGTEKLLCNFVPIQPFFFRFFVLYTLFVLNKSEIKKTFHFLTSNDFIKKKVFKSKFQNLKIFWRIEKTSKKEVFFLLQNLIAREVLLNRKNMNVRFEKTKVLTKKKISQNYFSFVNIRFFFYKKIDLNGVFFFEYNFFDFLKGWFFYNFNSFFTTEFRESKRLLGENFDGFHKRNFFASQILTDIQTSDSFFRNSFYYFRDCFLKSWFQNALFLNLPRWNETERYLLNLKQLMKILSSQKQEKLIQKLSQKILIWIFVNQKKVHFLYLRYLDQKTNLFLWQWACRRHQNKSKKWIQKKYFQKFRKTRWLFAHVFSRTIDEKNLEFNGQRKRLFSLPKNQSSFLYLPSHRHVFFYLQKKEIEKF